MSKQYRIIKIDNDKLYYTPSNYIALSKSNFPQTALFNKRLKPFWQIEIINYKKEEKILVVTIVDYSPKDINPFFEQNAKSLINGIEFCKLKWEQIEAFFSSYKKKDFSEIVDDFNIKTSDEKEDTPISNKIGMDNLREEMFFKNKITPINKTFTENFSYYFNDAKFKLGYVSIDKMFSFFNKIIELKIYNSEILPEYDFIRNYFPKVLNNNKKFKVKAVIEIKDKKVVKTRAYSPEIKKINDSLITSIKRLRILELSKLTQNEDVDKSLFTADEIWDNADDNNIDGNIFNDTEADIINILLENNDVRNRKQLEYLAGAKHNAKEKIRFTLQPLFGFIFYIEGENMNHFCWELLNSHATYLWSFEKTEKTSVQIKRVEEIVNIVRDTGRKKYKSAYLRNELDTDIFFNTINHKFANSDFKDSFVLWKHKFKELLV